MLQKSLSISIPNSLCVPRLTTEPYRVAKDTYKGRVLAYNASMRVFACWCLLPYLCKCIVMITITARILLNL